MAATKLNMPLLGLLFLLPGCGAALESAQVKSRFAALFQCGAAQTSSESGGYRVEGCGRVAHFRCFDTRDHHHDSLGEALFDGLFSSDTCVLEHTSEAPRQQLREGPAKVAAENTPKGPVVRTQIMLPGGHLQLRGRPLEHAEHVLMTLHGTERLAAAPCTAQLYQDGVAVPILQIRRSSEYDVQLLVPVAALHDVKRAVRFAGEACGKSFDLNEHARTTLALFEARFREEIARAQTRIAARPALETPRAPADATGAAREQNSEIPAVQPAL